MGLIKSRSKVIISLVGYDFGFSKMDEFDWFNENYPKLFKYINKNYNINIRLVQHKVKVQLFIITISSLTKYLYDST